MYLEEIFDAVIDLPDDLTLLIAPERCELCDLTAEFCQCEDSFC